MDAGLPLTAYMPSRLNASDCLYVNAISAREGGQVLAAWHVRHAMTHSAPVNIGRSYSLDGASCMPHVHPCRRQSTPVRVAAQSASAATHHCTCTRRTHVARLQRGRRRSAGESRTIADCRRRRRHPTNKRPSTG